jgi:hypothetical protein
MSTISNAERQLEGFLSSLPAYKRKVLELYVDPDFTIEEAGLCLEELSDCPCVCGDALIDEYFRRLERVPGGAKWYQKRVREIYGAFASHMPMPRVRRGRPQKDAEAEEMATLENAGRSHCETAAYLNDKYATEINAGKMTKRTPDNVRKLLSLYYEHPNR